MGPPCGALARMDDGATASPETTLDIGILGLNITDNQVSDNQLFTA